MQGQANHFFRYAPEKIPYGIERYQVRSPSSAPSLLASPATDPPPHPLLLLQTETRRLYSVYEKHLANPSTGGWLVGRKYSYADLISWAWIRAGSWAGVDLAPFPELSAWVDRIEARAAVQKGMLVPDGTDKISELRRNPALAEEEARKATAWIMKGVEKDKQT